MKKKELNQADLARVRAYIQSVEWRFAKTMPQWPHFYTIFEWNQDKAAEYYYFAYLIHQHGVIIPGGENRWSYLQVDGYKYWVIDNVLNRADPKPNAVVLEEGRKYLANEQKCATESEGK